MARIIRIISFAGLLCLFAHLQTPTYATVAISNCGSNGPIVTSASFTDPINTNTALTATMTFNLSIAPLGPDHTFQLQITDEGHIGSSHAESDAYFLPTDKSVSSITLTTHNGVSNIGVYTVQLINPSGGGTLCKLGSVAVVSPALAQASCNISMPSNVKMGENAHVDVTATSVEGVSYMLELYPKNIGDQANLGRVYISSETTPLTSNPFIDSESFNPPSFSFDYPTAGSGLLPPLTLGSSYDYLVQASVRPGSGDGEYIYCSRHPFTVTNDSTTSPITTTPAPNPVLTPGAGGWTIPKYTTGTTTSAAGSQTTLNGTGGSATCDPGYVGTSIGCVPTDPGVLVNDFIKIAFAMGGGIALLLMAIGAIRMIASAGNPEEVKHGQEQFVSAIIGLIFIILAIALMQILGVQILSLWQA